MAVLDPAVAGNYYAGNWSTEGGITVAAAYGVRGYAGFAVTLPDSSSLVSASLTVTVVQTYASGNVEVRVLSAPATTAPSNSDPGSDPAVTASLGTAPGTVDVTAAVGAVLSHAQWNPNTRHIGFQFRGIGSAEVQLAAQLTLVIAVIASPQGTAALSYELALAGTGTAPIPPEQGTGAVGYRLALAALGQAPDSPRGVAALTYGLGLAGQAPAPTGAAALAYRLGLEAASTAPPPPPPPPWRDAIHTAAYRNAIAARSVTIDARVDILDPSGAVIARLGGPDATHGGIVGGTVSVLESRDAWWDCDLSIDQAELTPTEVGDLLHPLSHNRLKVWWRILVAPGRWVEVPVGVYYADWPSVSYDGGVSVSMQVRGQDVSWLIARAEMQSSVSVGGATVDEAIRAVLTASAGWAPLALTTTGRRLPAGYEAGEPGANPWTVARRLASSVGMELRVTREGTIELGPTRSPSAPPVAAFVEGPGCTAIAASTSVPTGSIANRFRVDVNPGVDPDDNEIAPFSATATDDDPTSPLWIGHGYYYDKSTSTDAVTSVEAARNMAEGLLRARQALSETGELVIFPAPHLEVDDVIDVSIPSVAMVGARQVRGWTLALGDLGGMRVPVSGRRRW